MSSPFAGLKRAFKPSNRSLIRELVVSDFKIRYQGSILGYLWSLLRPLMLFTVLYVVFTKIIRLGDGVPYYPTYLLLGIVAWTFFVEATVSGMNAITGRGDLIRKINIPKYTIVISTTLSAFINFALNMGAVLVFMTISQVPFRLELLWALPLIAELVVLALGVSFLLAALFVKYRDVSHIWEVILQIMFYAVPIIYPLTMPPQWLRELLSLNPVTQILQDLRSVLITPETLTVAEVFDSAWPRIWSVAVVITIAALAGIYFRRAARNFAEEI
ncbi:MAG: ABC transporter permease [Candidatus Saccharimonadales bacterium]